MIDILLGLNSKSISIESSSAIRIAVYAQSNGSAGRGEQDIPVYLQGEMSNVDGEGHNVYIRNRTNDGYEMINWSEGNTESGPNLCPTLVIGYLACQYYKKDIYMHKVAWGARPLDKYVNDPNDRVNNPVDTLQGYGYDYWDLNSKTEGEFFDLLTTGLEEGKQYFDANSIKYYDLGLVFIQGEADARSDASNRRLRYEANLNDLDTDIRNYVNNESFRFVCNVLHQNSDRLYVDDIRTIQANFADPNKKRYSFDLSPYQLWGDSVHYPNASIVSWATDLFNTYLKL